MGLQRAPVQKFQGLNTVVPPYDLEPGEASVVNNVRPVFVDDDESIESRGGMAIRATGSVPSGGGYTGAGAQTIGNYMADGIRYNDTVLWWGWDNASMTALWATTTGTSTVARVQIGNNPFNGDYTAAVAASGATPWLSQAKIFLIPQKHAFAPGAKIVDTAGFAVSALAGTNIPLYTCSLVYWRGRLVCINQDVNDNRVARLLYSNIGDPTNWGPPNTIDIYDQSDSNNCALVVHNNNLYLMKQDSVWMIYDPNTFANRLICAQGMGWKMNTRAVVSCPYDKRLYWFDPQTGLIWSTNGETDLVCENKQCPITTTAQGFVQMSSVGTYTARMVYDDKRKSILISYQSDQTVGQLNDKMDELVLRGTPGHHPVFRHTIKTMGLVTQPGSRIISTGDGNVNHFYDTFGASVGDSVSGNILSQWMGGWMPVISEEPTERIRRVNMIYWGAPTINVASEMRPEGIPGVTPVEFVINPATYNPGPLDKLDRTFVSARGPNKKGRYHRLNVTGSGVNPFGLSAVEFALRGGKEKK